MDQPGKVANPVRGQPNRKNKCYQTITVQLVHRSLLYVKHLSTQNTPYSRYLIINKAFKYTKDALFTLFNTVLNAAITTVRSTGKLKTART